MIRRNTCYLICKYNYMTFLVVSLFMSGVLAKLFVANLDPACFRCLCTVLECDRDNGCTGPDGYCGPFQISLDYWEDAGKPVLPGQKKKNKAAFEACAKDYDCSTTIVQEYVAKYARDCNNDGVTDCFDFIMMHSNGRYKCSTPLNATADGRTVLKLFSRCVL